MRFKIDPRVRALLVLAVATLLGAASAREFLKMREPDELFPGPGVTATGMLGDYYPALADTPGDTPVYFLKGSEPGGKVLVLGGTHNDEISGQVTAITLLENARVTRGELIVIPRANASGATFVQEMLGMPAFLELETEAGIRRIRTGCRYSNPAHEYPDPDVFVNANGAQYPGTESRNLNRVYPGRDEGYLMEKTARGIIEFIKRESIDLVVDLHEAVPEHYVVNCLVGHNRSMEIVAAATMELLMQGMDIKMYESPGVYGFSHRDIGDNTGAYVVLAETTDILQGAFRGKPTQALLQDGKDPFYDIVTRKGKVFVNYDSEQGAGLTERVARHLTTVRALANSMAYVDPDKALVMTGIPEYAELLAEGIEAYLVPKR